MVCIDHHRLIRHWLIATSLSAAATDRFHQPHHRIFDQALSKRGCVQGSHTLQILLRVVLMVAQHAVEQCLPISGAVPCLAVGHLPGAREQAAGAPMTQPGLA